MDPQEGKGNEQDEVFPLGRELALACSRGFFLFSSLDLCIRQITRGRFSFRGICVAEGELAQPKAGNCLSLVRWASLVASLCGCGTHTSDLRLYLICGGVGGGCILFLDFDDVHNSVDLLGPPWGEL